MVNSNKSCKKPASWLDRGPIKLLALLTGYVIGIVVEEDEARITLLCAYSFGLAQNDTGFVFGPIRFYDPADLYTIYKNSVQAEMRVPEQALDAYNKLVIQVERRTAELGQSQAE